MHLQYEKEGLLRGYVEGNCQHLGGIKLMASAKD
jgi:hypothetical protein